MPARKKKQFINKKEATTYRLIPGFVEDTEDTSPKDETPEETAARKEEERKYGIFYDDTYNYMKHLRSLQEEATLVSTETFHIDRDDDIRSVASHPPIFFDMMSTNITEEELDPDILEALENAPAVKITDEELEEGAVGGENLLEDDFIAAAGGAVPKSMDDFDSEDDDFDIENEESEEDEDVGVSDNDHYDVSDDDMEGDTDRGRRQGRGTKEDDIVEAQTALILRNFEEGHGFRCSNQISDDETEMPTEMDYENLKRILSQDKEKETPVSWSEVLDDRNERPKINSEDYLYEDEDEIVWKEAPSIKPKFDCVSILSLYSNTQNRPTDILPPRSEKKKKRGNSEQSEAPSELPGLSLKQLEAEMRESRRADKAGTFRPKDETVDERKSRKKAIKEERKERRQEKKANKEVFAKEKEQMQKESAALSKAVKSVKIS